MNFPPQFLDEIRQRIAVSDVVGKRVPLKRAGREYVGLSPFKTEKTPSFTVNDEKGFYHCFASGEHGDVFTFLMKVEGLSFPEAVERLAAQAGLPMPTASPMEAEKFRRQTSLFDCLKVAAEWYQAQLKTDAAGFARQYAVKRGLKPATVAAFALGFAPQSRAALKEAMLARKFTEQQLLEAGLLIKPEDGTATYDRFRNRLMFPIRDRQGRVVAFGGRALDDAKAKYLNSPETALFHKGHLLYNLDKARKAAQETKRVIVVEGYMDVIALAQAGFPDAVAPLGTALTEQQIVELWRLADEPVLCFDGDSAGRKAAARAVERVLPGLTPGKSLMFAWLPESEDPDSLVRTKGSAAMKAVLDAARPLADTLWDGVIETHRTDTPERRSGFERALMGMIAEIRDEAVKARYREEMRRRLRTFFTPPPEPNARSFSSARRRGAVPPVTAALKRSLLAMEGAEAHLLREAVILLTVVNHPALLDQHFELLCRLHFHAPDLDKLRSKIIPIAAGDSDLDSQAFRNHLLAQGYEDLLGKLEALAAGRSETEWFMRNDAALQDVEKAWLHLAHRHLKLQDQEELRHLVAAELSDTELEALVLRKKAQLERKDGDEAAIDGYGIASGLTRMTD
jgi:DNA primase